MSGNATLKILKGNDDLLSFKYEPVKPKAKSALSHEKKVDQKARKVSSSNFFYSFLNHSDLHKLGQEFEKDFKDDKKSFALSSPYSEDEDFLTSLALASYFGAFCNVKSTIIVSSNELSKINSFIYDFEQTKLKLKKSGVSLPLHKSSFVNIVVLEDIMYLVQSKKGKEIHFDDILKEILNESKVTFLSVSNDLNQKNTRSYYFNILKAVSSISLMVTFGEDRFDELDEQLELLHNYNVEVKGVILREKAKPQPKEKTKKRGRRR